MTVTLRAATLADAPVIQAIYAPIVTETPISFEVVAPDVDEIATRMSTIMERYPYIVALHRGTVVGYCYGAPYRSRAAYGTTVETTIYVAQSARGLGIGRTLYGELLPNLSARGFHRAVAGITLPNVPSVALHEALGFIHVGTFTEVGHKFGRYHDVGYWERPVFKA